MKHPTKKFVYNKIFYPLKQHGGKLLDSCHNRKYFIYMRDRESETSYFLINIKGNYIRAYRIQYIENDKPINIFVASIIAHMGGNFGSIQYRKELICKSRFADWESFIQAYRELTPTLGWFDDEPHI